MDINVDMIFKIAAIGIIVAVLNQVLIRAWAERSGDDDHTGGDRRGALHHHFDDQSVLFGGKDDVYALKKEALCFRLQLWD